jgi:hypothetical protein
MFPLGGRYLPRYGYVQYRLEGPWHAEPSPHLLIRGEGGGDKVAPAGKGAPDSFHESEGGITLLEIILQKYTKDERPHRN